MNKFPYAEENLSPDAVKLFEPVLEWLDQGAPHMNLNNRNDVGFNMEYFRFTVGENDKEAVDDYSGNVCGTACCIAGATASFNQSFFTDLPSDPLNAIAKVGARLGMNKDQVEALFYGNEYDSETGELSEDGFPLSEITPSMAAATTRRFLKTGVISWSEKE